MSDLRIKEFIETKWSEYAIYDNFRSLPHIMDGFKITQRKAIHAFHKLKLENINVERASSKVAAETNYNHGDTSMHGVVTKLAQDFPGTNNFPLLSAEGQFGSRINHDPSAPRYIYASLSDNFYQVFDELDMNIIEYIEYEGDLIEPKFFIPKLPLILINGVNGVGNGFKCTIFNYKYEDVKNAVFEVLKCGAVKTKLKPYLNGWTGKIEKIDKQAIFTGTLEVVNTTTIRITEIPHNYDLDSYKEDILIPLINGRKIKRGGIETVVDAGFIKSFVNDSTPDCWNITITCPRTTTALSKHELLEKFGLIYKMTETITLWMPDGKLKTFDNVEEVVEDWVDLRLEFYEQRKNWLIKKIKDDLYWLGLKQRFIHLWNTSYGTYSKMKRKDLLENIMADLATDEVYADKLLDLKIYSLTLDEVEKLNRQIKFKAKELKDIESISSNKMMIDELNEL